MKAAWNNVAIKEGMHLKFQSKLLQENGDVLEQTHQSISCVASCPFIRSICLSPMTCFILSGCQENSRHV